MSRIAPPVVLCTNSYPGQSAHGDHFMSHNRIDQVMGLLAGSIALALTCSLAGADIYEWTSSSPSDPLVWREAASVLVPDGAGVSAIPGTDLRGLNLSRAYLHYANLSSATLADTDLTDAIIWSSNFSDTTSKGFTQQQLYDTYSYKEGLLLSIDFSNNDMSGWNFEGQALSSVSFESTNLTGAQFSGAIIWEANFANTTRLGFTESQLASTYTYQVGDLTGFDLSNNNMSSWSLSKKDLRGADMDNATLINADISSSNLTYADFRNTDLTGVNFSHSALIGADLATSILTGSNMQGADLRYVQGLTGAKIASFGSRKHLIEPDGVMRGGLSLGNSDFMKFWSGPDIIRVDLPFPSITIEQEFMMDQGATLRFELQGSSWDRPIEFGDTIDTVHLGGSLEIMHDPNRLYKLGNSFGYTFKLFDWRGVGIDGEFDRIIVDPVFAEAGLGFDFSRLYTTGEVRVIPEPGSGVLLGLIMLLVPSRR